MKPAFLNQPFFKLGTDFEPDAVSGSASATKSAPTFKAAANSTPAAITDAVHAAVKVMNRLDDTPTSVMGSFVGDSQMTTSGGRKLIDDIDATDKIIRTTIHSAIYNQGTLGPASTIRLGLLAYDWSLWKEHLCKLALIAQISAQETADFRGRAENMARNVFREIHGEGHALYSISAIPWKRVLYGLSAAIAVVFGWKLWHMAGTAIVKRRPLSPKTEPDGDSSEHHLHHHQQ